MHWEFPEYEQYVRPHRWYLVMGSLTGLLALTALLSRNYLFLVVILLAAFILFAREARPPRAVRIDLTDKGVSVGREFLLYGDLESFWLIYDPPEVKKLYLQGKGAIRPPLGVPLTDRNPVKVREILRQYLKEELDREEPPADQVSRDLRIS